MASPVSVQQTIFHFRLIDYCEDIGLYYRKAKLQKNKFIYFDLEKIIHRDLNAFRLNNTCQTVKVLWTVEKDPLVCMKTRRLFQVIDKTYAALVKTYLKSSSRDDPSPTF